MKVLKFILVITCIYLLGSTATTEDSQIQSAESYAQFVVMKSPEHHEKTNQTVHLNEKPKLSKRQQKKQLKKEIKAELKKNKDSGNIKGLLVFVLIISILVFVFVALLTMASTSIIGGVTLGRILLLLLSGGVILGSIRGIGKQNDKAKD